MTEFKTHLRNFYSQGGKLDCNSPGKSCQPQTWGVGGILIGVLLPNIVASPFTQNVLHVVLYPIKLAIQLPQLSSGSKFSEHPEQSSPVNP